MLYVKMLGVKLAGHREDVWTQNADTPPSWSNIKQWGLTFSPRDHCDSNTRHSNAKEDLRSHVMCLC